MGAQGEQKSCHHWVPYERYAIALQVAVRAEGLPAQQQVGHLERQ
jgi:hypothetical protein